MPPTTAQVAIIRNELSGPTASMQPEWEPTLDRVWWWYELPITPAMEDAAAKLISKSVMDHLLLIDMMSKVEGV